MTDYYVRDDGDDGQSGLSDINAWRTLANTSSLSPGDRLYLKCGSHWVNQQANCNWGGHTNTRAVLGAYYVDGSGNEIHGVSGNKPILEGTIDTSDTTDRWDNNFPGRGVGIVQCATISNNASSNFRIENIKVLNSGGNGVNVDDTFNVIVDGCETDTVLQGGIGVQRCDNITIENCNVYRGSYSYPTGMSTNWAGVIACTSVTNFVIRNNIHRGGWGEGIMAQKEAQDGLIEGNIVFASRSVALYMCRSQRITVRRNMVVQSGDTTFWRDGHPGLGINVANEEFVNYDVNHDLWIYDNLVVNASTGLGLSPYRYKNDEGQGTYNVYYYHNTVVDCEISTDVRTQGDDLTVHGVGNNNFVNNIFAFYDRSIDHMSRNAIYPGVADYHHNVWAGSQSDVASDYQGTGDKYGDPLLNRTSGWASFTSYDQPDVSDFHLQLGSPAIDVADDNWPFDEFQRDWYGNTRPVVTPDMGAIEFGSDEGGGGQFDTVPLRINCGGDTTTFTDGTGADWEQDRGYNAGTEPAQVTDAIAGTTDDELYQWTRLVGPGSQNTQALPLRYSFDIPNGIYTVRLHYNETYWEETNRFFNVFINDVQVENELCIWLEAGGKNTALARTHENVEVTDEVLNIDFKYSASAPTGEGLTPDPKPLVAAIEVLAASAVPATGALVFKSSSPVVDAQTDPGVEPPRSALPEIGVVRLRGGTTLDLTIRNFAPEQGLVIMLSPINRSDANPTQGRLMFKASVFTSVQSTGWTGTATASHSWSATT